MKISNRKLLQIGNAEINLEPYQQTLWRPKQSAFEFGDWPVVKASGNTLEVANMHWEFIPHYIFTMEEVNKQLRKGYVAKDGKFKPPILTLNAKGEELLKPGKIFRDAALNRRCLIFSSGFYEWRHIFPMGKKGLPLKTAVKYPYHIKLPDQEFFFIAGIWQPWTDRQTGETMETLSLVTTASNSLMSKVHNSKFRQPCILTEELAEEWISPGLTESRILEISSHQYDAGRMTAHPISKDFMSLDEPATAVEYEELPPLD